MQPCTVVLKYFVLAENCSAMHTLPAVKLSEAKLPGVAAVKVRTGPVSTPASFVQGVIVPVMPMRHASGPVEPVAGQIPEAMGSMGQPAPPQLQFGELQTLATPNCELPLYCC